MAKFGECATGVAVHGDFDVSFVVFPVEVHAYVKLAFPVSGDFLMVLDGVDEVVGVIFVEVFYTEVVDAESEGGLASFVFPESWCELHWFVSVWAEFCDELFECYDSGFFKAVHAATDFEIDVSFGFDGEVVLVHDLLGDEFLFDPDVLEVTHGSAQVEVFYV